MGIKINENLEKQVQEVIKAFKDDDNSSKDDKDFLFIENQILRGIINKLDEGLNAHKKLNEELLDKIKSISENLKSYKNIKMNLKKITLKISFDIELLKRMPNDIYVYWYYHRPVEQQVKYELFLNVCIKKGFSHETVTFKDKSCIRLIPNSQRNFFKIKDFKKIMQTDIKLKGTDLIYRIVDIYKKNIILFDYREQYRLHHVNFKEICRNYCFIDGKEFIKSKK